MRVLQAQEANNEFPFDIKVLHGKRKFGSTEKKNLCDNTSVNGFHCVKTSKSYWP